MINLFENLRPHKTRTQIFIALLVIIAKTVSNQDVLQHVRGKKKTVRYLYNGILFSDKNK